MPLLEVNDLRVRYKEVQALDVSSFVVEEGEFVCVLGANGAGKSSLLRGLSRVADITGSVKFDGQELARLRPSDVIRRGVVHCPEGRHLFPQMTVLENLHMGAYLQKDKASIKGALDYVIDVFPVLGERGGQRAGTLSGGEQQMCALGRALMSKPRLLLLDEPSFGLAPIMVQRIMDVLSRLHADGLAIVLVEQNAAVALEKAGRGYVLEAGSVVRSGTARELSEDEDIRRIYLGVA